MMLLWNCKCWWSCKRYWNGLVFKRDWCSANFELYWKLRC
jgi:hypothetical protein